MSFKLEGTDPDDMDLKDLKTEVKVTSIPLSFQRIDDPGVITERIKLSDDLEDILAEDADFIVDKLRDIEQEEALDVIRNASEYFVGDMNFPRKSMEKIHLLLRGPEAYGQGPEYYDLDLRLEAAMIKYHSPYPEVRSVCSPVDDPTMQCETLRVYVIAGLWTSFAAFVNNMIYWRQPYFQFSSQVIQLLILPTGQTWAKIMPDWNIGYGKYKARLNPGPWTFKEQMLSTIMANAGVSVCIFIYYMPTMRLKRFYGQTWMTYGFNILMSFSCQYFGLSMAGILRRWVIYPVKAVWPTVLPTLQLNRTLLLPEKKVNIHGWTISKYKFFNIALGASFLYFFLPDYLFTALATFNWMTWIAPQNKHLAFVTGSKIGVGINPVSSFDWSVINYAYPLIVPFFTSVNRYIGTFIGAMIVLGMIYSNYLNTGYVPPNLATVYDRYGTKYNVTRVMTDNRFDLQKYESYSPPYITAGALLLNGAEYTLVTFGFCYILLTEWKTMSEAMRGFIKAIRYRESKAYEQFDDPMSRMMSKYKEVPDWWYLLLLLLSIALGIVCITCWPTETPVWAFVAIILITIAMIIPSMIMYASTGYMYTVYLLATLLGGYWVPGSPFACIFTRSFGYGMDEQAETYVGDLKMGHYSRLPPRAVFRAQVFATLFQVLVGSAAWEMLQAGIPDLCSLTQASKFVCPFAWTMYSQSVMLGLIGPTRTFGTLYPFLKWAFLLGVGISVPIWYLRKRFPKQLHFFQPVLILAGIARWGSNYNLSYYTPGLIVSYVFMYYIRTRFAVWWAKYTYILSSGLTAGTAFCGILLFVSVQYHPKPLKWWGTTVSTAGVDGALKAAVFDIPESGFFGVPAGSWH